MHPNLGSVMGIGSEDREMMNPRNTVWALGIAGRYPHRRDWFLLIAKCQGDCETIQKELQSCFGPLYPGSALPLVATLVNSQSGLEMATARAEQYVVSRANEPIAQRFLAA